MGPTPKQPQTKFFQEDIVQRVVSGKSAQGVVLRCWHDSDDTHLHEPLSDPLLRPLKRGEVGVSFYPDNTREILPESSVELVDRPLQAGDVCKRKHDDAQSAVVTKTEVMFKISHAVSGKALDQRFTLADIKEDEDAAVGDFVVYDDWIGQVQNFFDESIIHMSNGTLVRLPEVSAHLAVGERGADIIPHPSNEGIQTFISYLLGDSRPSSNDTVVEVKHTIFVVAWMAINQTLPAEEISKRQRPPKFWHGADIAKLTLMRGVNDQQPRVGHRVTVRNPPDDFVTNHGMLDGKQYTVDVGVVWETETTVELLWQDGSRERCRSTSLIPYLNPDEYDCWPGDHIVWKTEDGRQAAVVQSVNAMDRTAVILLNDGHHERVSVLELDPHGAQADISNPQDAFGVRRGESVFIHREGSDNGCVKPVVPSIGEVEPWVRDAPFSEHDHNEFEGWHKELDRLGQSLAQDHAKESYKIGRFTSGDGKVRWFGEVTDLCLDGLIEVTFPDATTTKVPLERLTRLNDGLEQLEDLWGDEVSDAHSDGLSDGGRRTYEVQTEDGQWMTIEADDDDDWVEDEDVEMDDGDDGDDESGSDSEMPDLIPLSGSNGAAPTSDANPNASWQPILNLFNSGAATETSAPRTPDVPLKDSEETPAEVTVNGAGTDEPSLSKNFEILPSAPSDHAFISNSTGQPSRAFLGRLTREYRALETSLPDSVIVQTYEDRTDLLRSLIIGPENTPYEDAPFVIDWLLPSNFPQAPPIGHFWSWTNGNGRVNPNLYEEGKVCLSILGTWAGDRSESWSPSRSSLLQALVSIQGLVLVKEPYYCEPSYEKWRGTDEGRVQSRLYNEKAFVLSRGFVRRALEIPLGGLQPIIHDIYITNGRLGKVVNASRQLIAKSRETKDANEDTSDLAVPRLTDGGIIPLTRTLDKLEALLKSTAS